MYKTCTNKRHSLFDSTQIFTRLAHTKKKRFSFLRPSKRYSFVTCEENVFSYLTP